MNAETAIVPYEADGFEIPETAEQLMESFSRDEGVPVYSGKPNLQLSQETGEFTFGQSDREPVGPNDTFVINPASFVHGWRQWKQDASGKNIGPVMVVVKSNQPKPDKPPADEGIGPGESSRDGWKAAAGFTCRGVQGPAAGQTLEYLTDAKMAISAIESVKAAIASQHSAGKQAVYPVVKLSSTVVKTDFGKKRKPVITIAGFLTADHVRQLVSGKPATKPAEPDVIDVVAKEIPTEEAPRRRRN